jgi:hypothetical protein
MVPTSHQQLSVLIVEDEYHTRMAMARKLQAGGYSVTMAEEATTGLQLALNGKHDAILLDLGLPGGGGLDLLVKLRRFSEVPVIFISRFLYPKPTTLSPYSISLFTKRTSYPLFHPSIHSPDKMSGRGTSIACPPSLVVSSPSFLGP